jgi:hypothetical protein
VVRDNNVGTDVLSKLGSDRANVPPGVFIHELHHPSIKALDQITIIPISSEPDQEVMMIEVDLWTPFINFIKDQKLPSGIDAKSIEAARIFRRSKSYVLVNDKLYKRDSASGILLKCVPVEEGKEILQEIHEGVCGNHEVSRTLVGKAFRSGYYWPTALADAENFVGVLIASSLANKPMFRHITSSPYHHPGLSFAGAWT